MKNQLIQSMARVNHAGETAAVLISTLQLFYSKRYQNQNISNQLERILKQEEQHLEYFNNFLKQNKIRPSFFNPFWSFAIKSTLKLTSFSPKSTAVAIQAIEEVISNHYQNQIKALQKIQLPNKEDEMQKQILLEKIIQFQKEENEHGQIGQNYSEESILLKAEKKIVKFITNFAIEVSKKI